jgi:hypothetical protein
MRDEMRD